jgi:hypothetical protein
MSKYAYSPDLPRFSRRWWLSTAKTLFWVVLITLLIWLYADIELTASEEFRATVLLTTGKNRNLEILSQPDREVSFKLQGDRTSLDRFRQQLNDQGSLLRYDVSEKHGQGRVTIATEEVLMRAGRLDKQGITVKAPSPSFLEVQLDERIPQELTVELDHRNATLAYKEISPPKVTIYIAKSKWEALKDDKPALRTEPVDLKNQPTGKRVTLSAKLRPMIGGERVQLERSTVSVTLEILGKTDTKTLTVSVRVLGPPNWAEDGTWDRFVLKRREPLDWTRKIRVTGTKTDLGRLRPENVDAYVVLTEDDKTEGDTWLKKEVVIRFPEDLDVELAPGENHSVELNFKAKAVP